MDYDAVGQLLNRTQSDGSGKVLSTSSYTYEPGGQVARQINPLGGVTVMTYTQTGLPLTRQEPDGTSRQWLYLVDGRLAKETFANTSNRSYSYDDANRTVTISVRDSAGILLTTETQAFDRRGNLIRTTDAEGFTTNTSYDALNRVTEISGPAASTGSGRQKLTRRYDAAGLSRLDINALGEQTLSCFDAEARLVKIEVKGANGTIVRSVSYTYAADHQSVVTVQGLAGVQTTTFTNFQGKPVLVWNADGSWTSSRYDLAGNLTSASDALGRTTSYEYDGLNRVLRETLADGAQTLFVYDAAGNLLQRQMPGGLVWSAVYDLAARKVSEKLQQGTSTTRAFNFTYNLSGNGAGQLATMTDPRGIVTNVSYDALGRQTQVAALDSSAAKGGVTRSFTYDKRHKITQIDQTYQNAVLSPSSSVRRSFDGYGALATEQTFVAGLLKDTWKQAHDSAGRRIMLTELNNPAVPFTFKFQADGNLVETDFNRSAYFYEYKLDGRLYSRNTPLHAQVLSRDAMGRTIEAAEYVNGTLVLDEKIGWRADFTQSSNSIMRNGIGSWSESRSLTYDGRGRLASESFAAGAGITGSAAYQFDNGTTGGLGLRTGMVLAGNMSGSQTATFNALGRLSNVNTTGSLTGPLASGVSQTFDDAGNVVSIQRANGTDVLTWDALGRLIGVTRRDSGNSGLNWSAVYDGLGRRLQTAQQNVTAGALSGTTLTLKSAFDPDVEFLELSVSQGNSRTWLIHGPDLDGTYGGLQGTGGLEAVYNAATGSMTGIISDNSGHAEATVSSTGVVAWNRVACIGYGAAPQTSAPVQDGTRDLGMLLAWRGRYLDGTGFYCMGTRYYCSETGTFLSADPLGHAASASLYDYCSGDPANKLDPDGRVGKIASQGVRMNLNDHDNLAQSLLEGVGALKAVITGMTWQNNIFSGVFSSDNDPKNNGQTNAVTGKLMGVNELGVALPDKTARGKMVEIFNPSNGISVTVPVIDIGPHYVDDNYASSNDRPRAETRGNLYLSDPTKYKSFRRDRNRAGIDLSPATMKSLRIPVAIVSTRDGPEWQTTGNDPKLNWRYKYE